MLLRLAGFLRYSLDRQPTRDGALTAELEAQRKYLEIEQTRFDDKLKVRFNIEPGLENAKLPSLILQPILENAIKYAITPRVRRRQHRRLRHARRRYAAHHSRGRRSRLAAGRSTAPPARRRASPMRASALN